MSRKRAARILTASVQAPELGRIGLVEDGFANIGEVAEFLGLSRSKVYLLMDAGELQYCKFGKSRRVPRKAMMGYAARCLIGGPA